MSDEQASKEEAKRGLSRTGVVLAFLPFITFLALASIFWSQLESGKDPSVLPSALIGTQAPRLDMPPLEGSERPALTDSNTKGKLTLVNVWASWCIPCREEAPAIMAIASDKRLNVVGINYKDKPGNALRFLGELGNPFAAIGVDPNGKAAIDWGVYGIPESYLVDASGKIVYKKVGPFDAKSVETELLPAIEKALEDKKS
jgi:cytochrome c biogenesis protein CcmG, thiol:disulfide interchange protein DsbE